MASSRSEHCVEVMAKLNDQRHRENFCDVSLVVQGRQFKAHKSVLSAASPYFDMMFTCNMKEKEQEAVHLEELSVSAMERILDYIYTGDVQVNEENAQDLVASADYLLLHSLKTRAGEILQQNLDVSNCISTYYLAAKYECQDLLQSAREFINRNFISVSESENFLALTYDRVREWISSDDIIIRAEEDAFEVVLRWIGNDKSGERENHFLELFQNVRLTSLPRHYFFTEIIENKHVRGNPQCLDLMLYAMKQIAHASGEYLQRQNPRKCLEKHVDGLVLCGRIGTRCYLPANGCWYQLCTKNVYGNPGVSSCRGCMYAVGMNKAERYDPLINSWSNIQSPPGNVHRAAVVALQDFLYLIGGLDQLNSQQRVDSVYRYDPDTNSWQQVASLSSPRSHICTAADDNYIYAIGGRANNGCLSEVERFEPRVNAWTSLAPMTERRSYASGVVLGEKVFVFGGKLDGPGNTRTGACEMYICAINQWQVISSMYLPRYYASAVAFRGAIYVFGGSVRNTPEWYDPDKDEWVLKGTIPFGNYSGRACALRICKTVIQSLSPLSISY